MRKIPKTLKSFLWHFVKPHIVSFIIMFVAIFLLALHVSVSQYIFKDIIDKVEQIGNTSTQFYALLLMPVIIFVILNQLADLCWRIYDYCILKVMPQIKADITLQMFAYLNHHDFSYLQKQLSGSLANKINDMAKGAELILTMLIEPIFFQICALFIGAVSMYLIHPYFALVLLAWAVFFMGVVILLSKKAHYFSTLYSESRSLCIGKIVDSVTNALNIKLFAQSRFEKKYLKKYLNDSIVKEQKLQKYMLYMKFIQGFSVTVLLSCMLGLLLYGRAHGKVTVGDFTFILTLSVYLMQGLWYLASHFVMFSQELGMCSQALTIISTEHSMKDIPNASILNVSEGKIVFDNVSFQYVRGRNIFKNTNIIIKGGQKVGLVGFSGSGKTTFVNLILRFFDISGGKILIDGQNILEVTQDSLRSQIAMIPQDPILFHRTIMENIRYGCMDATDTEIIEAAKIAHCHEFIVRMEEGYNSLVGERGVKLSGGQRQRIAIARAIIKNAPILILDEATSALDSVTEQKIHESVEYLMQNRTSLVVAHRLSTLSNMDRILVFQAGVIVEDGTPQELMELQGHYAKLWDMQAGGFLPEKFDE